MKVLPVRSQDVTRNRKDVSFFGPLKTALKMYTADTFKKLKGKKITMYELASIFNQAYGSVASIRNAISGFEASGIWPVNRNKFSPQDFRPADVLKALSERQELPPTEPGAILLDMNIPILIQDGDSFRVLASTEVPPTEQQQTQQLMEINHGEESELNTSEIVEAANYCIPLISDPDEAGTSQNTITISVEGSKVKKGPKKQHSSILTSSPMKELLENKKLNREKKELKSTENKKKGVRVKQEKENTPGGKKRKLRKISMADKSKCAVRTKSTDSEEVCDVCQEVGKDEVWYRCRQCGKWSHAACVVATTAESFTCDTCNDK